MRSVRAAVVLPTAVVVALLVAVITAPAAAAAAPQQRYVALGDSYSSGLGAGTSYSGGSCDRSAGAFSALWAAAQTPAAYISLACAGATTSSVTSSQVPNLPAGTTLVSITAGGNDVGFTTIMTTCALQGTTACTAAVNRAETLATTTLPGQLDTTYRAIAAKAPVARVVVLDYPRFYQLHTWFCVGLSETSRAKIDEGIDLVDSQLAAAADRAGFVFADVRSAFVGHQLCSGSKWLHAVDLGDLAESYHPTATGQAQAYLPVFTAAAG